MPRRPTDFGGKNDDVYPALERSEQELKGRLDENSSKAGSVGRDWNVKDEDRVARSMEEMEKEANWLKEHFAQN